MIREELESALADMETMSKVFDIKSFDIYLLGGSGCVLAGYIDRATRDFDIMDLEYQAKLSRVFKLIEPFDMIDLQLATIAPSYKDRAIRLERFQYLHVYVLSREDIIISKIGRLNERDINDIKTMMPEANRQTLFRLINEVMIRQDLSQTAKNTFARNARRVMKECDLDV